MHTVFNRNLQAIVLHNVLPDAANNADNNLPEMRKRNGETDIFVLKKLKATKRFCASFVECCVCVGGGGVAVDIVSILAKQ